jgi:hypothetical protein
MMILELYQQGPNFTAVDLQASIGGKTIRGHFGRSSEPPMHLAGVQ